MKARQGERGKVYLNPQHNNGRMKGRNIALTLVLVLLLLLAVYLIAFSFPESPEGDLPLVERLAISIDSEDNLHIVWVDEGDGELYLVEDHLGLEYVMGTDIHYAKFDGDGRRLTEDQRLTSRAGDYPSIEIDSQDNIWITYWMNGTHIMKLTPEGEKVLEKELHSRTDEWVAIDVGSDDNIYLSWDECRRQCFKYFMSLDSDGNVLRGITNASLVTPVPGLPIVIDDNGRYVYLGEDGASDSTGNIHVARADGSENGFRICTDIFYSKINSTGQILINNTQITNGGWSCFSKIVIDSFDNIHIVDQTRGDLGYIELDDMGGVQRIMENIRAEGFEMQLYPNLDVDSLGNVHIVWHVKEVIRVHPHTHLEDYAYVGYLARIDRDASMLGDVHVVAKSATPSVGYLTQIIGIALLVVTLVMIVILVLLARMKKRRGDSLSS